MQLVHSDSVFEVPAGTQPNYRENNPLLKLSTVVQSTGLCAEREHYLPRSLQYLVPFEHLDMYGPQAPNTGVTNPELQNDKTDFQKQNLMDFVSSGSRMVRGWASTNSWTGPFLSISYPAGPQTLLSQATGNRLSDSIRAWVQVGAAATRELLKVPYDPLTDRYQLEIWGYPGTDLRDQLGPRGREAFDRGNLIAAPNLVKGNITDFARDGLDDRLMVDVAPQSAMHPIVPLHVQVAWRAEKEDTWDSKGGENYQFEFAMIQRGWDQYLSVGLSPNPHGGVGFLHYRNLLSNYGRYAGTRELGRTVDPWMFDAHGNKPNAQLFEDFMTVNYMDLHILKDNCGIGLHRHRDNSEIFLMMQGEALMVVGDWAKQPNRDRCFEVRCLTGGTLAMLRGGQLHGLLNTTDEDISLFMFGGYD